jgi:hypothetical protein
MLIDTMFTALKNWQASVALLRFHDERIENRYFVCKPRIARFTEVVGYKPVFWLKDPFSERILPTAV